MLRTKSQPWALLSVDPQNNKKNFEYSASKNLEPRVQLKLLWSVRAIVQQVSNLSCIRPTHVWSLTPQMSPRALLRVSSELRTRTYPWALMGCGHPTHKKKLIFCLFSFSFYLICLLSLSTPTMIMGYSRFCAQVRHLAVLHVWFELGSAMCKDQPCMGVSCMQTWPPGLFVFFRCGLVKNLPTLD